MAIAEKRTQIYLPLDLFGWLRKEAREEKKSVAQVIREAIEVYMEERAAKKANWESDPITKSIGIGPADPDLSAGHDKYLYGEKKNP